MGLLKVICEVRSNPGGRVFVWVWMSRTQMNVEWIAFVLCHFAELSLKTTFSWNSRTLLASQIPLEILLFDCECACMFFYFQIVNNRSILVMYPWNHKVSQKKAICVSGLKWLAKRKLSVFLEQEIESIVFPSIILNSEI